MTDLTHSVPRVFEDNSKLVAIWYFLLRYQTALILVERTCPLYLVGFSSLWNFHAGFRFLVLAPIPCLLVIS
jgi:hypothetical protein